jgi:hypothetical protein
MEDARLLQRLNLINRECEQRLPVTVRPDKLHLKIAFSRMQWTIVPTSPTFRPYSINSCFSFTKFSSFMRLLYFKE